MPSRPTPRNIERALLRSGRFTALLSRSALARRLYLGTFSTSYDRESHSVLSGLAVNRNAKRDQPSMQLNYYSLRRQIHRLEKGLIASPRRSVFAADYAPKVVAALAGAPDEWQRLDPDLYAWSLGVLTDYFNAIDYDNDPRLQAAQRQFARLTKDSPCDLDGRAPYPASERPPLTVDYDDLHQLYRRRRSVRWFEPTPVPRELLDQALVAASQAPSACNRQPYRFVIADEPTDAQALGGLAFGTVGFAQQFPCCIALVGELSAFSDLRDRHVIYIDGGLVAMSFVLACETLGLATCLINWPDLPEHDVPAREFLHLADHEQIIVLIAVGYAADGGGVPRSVKKDVTHLRDYRGDDR